MNQCHWFAVVHMRCDQTVQRLIPLQEYKYVITILKGGTDRKSCWSFIPLCLIIKEILFCAYVIQWRHGVKWLTQRGNLTLKFCVKLEKSHGKRNSRKTEKCIQKIMHLLVINWYYTLKINLWSCSINGHLLHEIGDVRLKRNLMKLALQIIKMFSHMYSDKGIVKIYIYFTGSPLIHITKVWHILVFFVPQTEKNTKLGIL